MIVVRLRGEAASDGWVWSAAAFRANGSGCCALDFDDLAAATRYSSRQVRRSIEHLAATEQLSVEGNTVMVTQAHRAARTAAAAINHNRCTVILGSRPAARLAGATPYVPWIHHRVHLQRELGMIDRAPWIGTPNPRVPIPPPAAAGAR